MTNLHLDFYPIFECRSHFGCGLRDFERADVSSCSGFIQQVLLDLLR